MLSGVDSESGTAAAAYQRVVAVVVMGISGNWSDLPIEILDEILTEVDDIKDLIRCGAVCQWWRSASLDSMKSSCGPWLMLSEPEPRENFLDEDTLMLITMFQQEEDDDKSNSKVVSDEHHVPRRFFNLCTKKTIELYLPEAQGRRCWGSAFGWLLTIGIDLNIHLLNPLTRFEVSLPSQPTFQNQYRNHVPPEHLRRVFVDKFALSTHPNNKHHQENKEECVAVMVIYSASRTLAIARPGDSAWTNVKCPPGCYEDVIFFNNLFYAVYGDDGNLVVCDITTTVPVATDFMSGPLRLVHSYKYYLVEMSGDLHMVVRMHTGKEILDAYFVSTADFRVYKLDFIQKQWIQLQDLGHNALFLGNNTSFAISTINHPQLPSNFIYFTDDYVDIYRFGNCDLGLFDFGEKKIMDPFYFGDCVRSTFCAPLFFIPDLH